MSKENGNNNIYHIPQTLVSSELSKSNVDYIDYIYSDTENKGVEVDIDANSNNSTPVQNKSLNTHQIEYIRQSYARSAEEAKSKEIAEIIDISKEINDCRANFIAQGLQLNSVKGGIIRTIFGASLKRPVTLDQLKSEESEIGSTIFGSKPGVQTVFFNDNEQSWFFYQTTTGRRSEENSVTLHYEVHPEGVLRIKDKEINGCLIEGEELKNFTDSVHIYRDLVMEKIYKNNSDSGKLAT